MVLLSTAIHIGIDARILECSSRWWIRSRSDVVVGEDTRAMEKGKLAAVLPQLPAHDEHDTYPENFYESCFLVLDKRSTA
jgi:hypothetical protein